MNRREAIRKTTLAAGATAFVPMLTSILQSCQSQPRLSWKPAFLTEDEARVVSILVDTWLPQTDTPGALDMKVDMFVDQVFNRLYDKEAQAYVKTELQKMNDACKERFGKQFISLKESDRTAFMKGEEQNSGKFNPSVWGTTVGDQPPIGFYRNLKSMAMWGYFTSEEIGTNILNYDPVPGTYEGCISLSDIGNSWSL